MRMLALLLLLPQLALAQARFHVSPDMVRTSDLFTTAPLTLYVDPLGSNAKACTSTTTEACLTIPGALGKVPKNIRHPVVINVAAGSYAGARIDGFRVVDAAATTGASLTIQGTLATATLGAGTATGTATSGTRGGETATPAVHATVVDSGNTWTTNALRGYFLALTGGPGSGDLKAIESNTGTSIVAAGRLSAIPTSSTTYAIQEAVSIISSAGTRNADLTLTTGAVAGFVLQNNSFPPGTLLIQKLKFTNTGTYGIYMQTPTDVMVRYSNFSPGGTTNGMTVTTGGTVDVLSCTWPAITSSSYTAIHQTSRVTSSTSGIVGSSEVALGSSVFVGSGGSNGVVADMSNGALWATSNYGAALQKGFWLGNNVIALLSGDFFSTVVQYCVATSLAMNPGATTISVNGENFTSCGKAIYLTGPGIVTFTSVASTGSSNTTGLYLENGARVISHSTGYGFSGSTDILIKTLGADTTSTAADFRLLTPRVLSDANTLTGITEL